MKASKTKRTKEMETVYAMDTTTGTGTKAKTETATVMEWRR